MTYKEWISANVVVAYGMCKEVTAAMAKDFPELRRVRGHYCCPFWGERQHWWLVTGAGEIVDPTAEQFPSKGMGEYVEWDESAPQPTGKCPNCGGYAYDYRTCCSDECHDEYSAYCMERR